jgi:galactokinase
MISVMSLNLGEKESFWIGKEAEEKSRGWGKYVRGVIIKLSEAGLSLRKGFDLTLSSTLPIAAGLSSSAALEAAVGLSAAEINGLRIDRETLASICRRAENDYVGVGCGIMDQLIVCKGRHRYAMMLDCRSVEARFVSIPADLAIVVCDTGSNRDLAASEYNRRVRECEQALAVLGGMWKGVNSLRDVSIDMLNSSRTDLGTVLYRRCRHIVGENARVLALVEALNTDDKSKIYELMAASHKSLRDDYEVSSAELDAMVAVAERCTGFVGARLTGAGFGGATVNLVEKVKAHEFAQEVIVRYEGLMGMGASAYVCETSNGVEIGLT